jgi:hypoxia up-regulated 1
MFNLILIKSLFAIIIQLLRIVGKTSTHPNVKELEQQYFPYKFLDNITNGHTYFNAEGAIYTAEELLAMIMHHIKEMTESFGGKAIKDCVITVPSYFTHHERKSLYVAADIAELRVLTLVEENTAAALYYGMDRVFEFPTNVIFFNLGSSSTQVSIV